MSGSEQVDFVHKLPRAEAIARLNDKLRQESVGAQLVVTRGVTDLHDFDPPTVLRALAAYDGFDIDNDPHGERDFGDIHVFGTDLLWKIDYYDLKLEYGSADPADADLTIRVLTVMLEVEY
jgi:hypothetical protein